MLFVLQKEEPVTYSKNIKNVTHESNKGILALKQCTKAQITEMWT